MPLRTEIEKALDELTLDEAGMRFQGLAVVLAKQKWPRLVASERRYDLGLDAYASGELEPDGRGMGLACSLTPEYDKIAADATKVKKNYGDVHVLVFATAGEVTNHKAKQWAEELRKDFGLELIVMSREELVTSLLDPANVDICRSQLKIPVEVKPELVPVAVRAREAAAEVTKIWAQRPRLLGRPLIDLDAEKVEEGSEANERLSIADLQTSLIQGRRVILEAPAGRGKTTTLVQIAQRTIDAGGLAFLVDLPFWVRTGSDILHFVAQAPSFVERGLDARAILELRGSEPFFFLLNGWNELSEGTVESAVQALRELEQNYPAAGIIVATRTHRILPPLPGAFRAKLLSLSQKQRDEYLDLALGKSATDLRAKLNNSRTLDELSRTPLILAEVADLFRKGKAIPATKMGVLAAVMRVLEESEEHQSFLQQIPLSGQASEYLAALSMAMTEKGKIEINDGDARSIVSSVSINLQKCGQLTALPEPMDVLNELSKRHVLERLQYPDAVLRFQHQQFQEFFAARGLKRRLLDAIRSGAADEDRRFAKQCVNEPRWGESLRMFAEDIAADGTNAEMVKAGSKLVRMALHVDPLFAADLASASGPAVWSEIRNDVGERLRAWYAQRDGNHRQCALAAMLATGSDDFRDVLLPLLSNTDNQVRLSVYYGGVEVLPSSLGPNWQEVIRTWSEEARIDSLSELARDPWLADIVENFALSDPSPKVRWHVAHILSWHGFTGKVEALLGPLDNENLLDATRASHPEEIPASLRPRVVGLYERMYTGATDPLERLRLLHVLQGFGGTNMVERMKAELDGLGPDQLKPGDNQGQIRWALDELQKSDPKWVSEWAARKVLDKSIWFGAWRGLITQISSEEQEALYSRLSTEVLDQGEQQRVVSVLGSVMNAALAARVFGRACEIRAGLSFPPGHDQAKWNLFRQLEDLLRTISPAMLLEGISEKLENEPEDIELDILTDTLPATNLTKPDVRSSISEDMRVKFRAYLKRGAEMGADPYGLRANTRAHLAQLLANVGEPEDLADIRRLIDAYSVRFKEAQAARMKGDRSHDETGYGFLYLDAVTVVDPVAADDLLVELIHSQQYEHVLAQRLPLLARKTKPQGFGTDRMDFKKIWKSRAGEPDESFLEERRIRYTDAILEVVGELQKEREEASDKRGFDYRLKILAGTLAALDGKRSANLVLELMELPGSWDGWTRVGAVENLLVSGVRMTLEQALRILEPTMQQLQSSGMYNDNQNVWLFARCLCVMAFVDPPAAGVAKIREIISSVRFPPHEMGIVAAALGASRCEDAIDVLLDVAGPDGTGIEAMGGEAWIEAIRALGGKRASDILLSFVDPNAKLFSREFIPDHRHGDLLARLLAQLAAEDSALKTELVRLANGDLPPTKRMLVAKVFGRFSTEKDLAAGLCVLRDDGSGVPYELVRSMEDVFLERRPYGTSGHAYTLSPLGCNAVRKRLFDMVIGDPLRRNSAFALLGQIEAWRLEHGRPSDEPRHPAIESDVPWPPLLS